MARKLIIVYVVCADKKEASVIGEKALSSRLAACYNVFGPITSGSLWPPGTGDVERATETGLILKTAEDRFDELAVMIKSMHSYKNPCILAFPVTQASAEYAAWILGETEKQV